MHRKNGKITIRMFRSSQLGTHEARRFIERNHIQYKKEYVSLMISFLSVKSVFLM